MTTTPTHDFSGLETGKYAGHTPWEWRVSTSFPTMVRARSSWAPPGKMDGPATSVKICDTENLAYLPSSVSRANALLIADAPRLLAHRDHLQAVNAELLADGEALNDAAWMLVRELMGQSDWRVSDDDHSEYANKMRTFLAASNRHRAAISIASGGAK